MQLKMLKKRKNKKNQDNNHKRIYLERENQHQLCKKQQIIIIKIKNKRLKTKKNIKTCIKTKRINPMITKIPMWTVYFRFSNFTKEVLIQVYQGNRVKETYQVWIQPHKKLSLNSIIYIWHMKIIIVWMKNPMEKIHLTTLQQKIQPITKIVQIVELV